MPLTIRSKRRNASGDGACNALGERTYNVTFEVEWSSSTE